MDTAPKSGSSVLILERWTEAFNVAMWTTDQMTLSQADIILDEAWVTTGDVHEMTEPLFWYPGWKVGDPLPDIPTIVYPPPEPAREVDAPFYARMPIKAYDIIPGRGSGARVSWPLQDKNWGVTTIVQLWDQPVGGQLLFWWVNLLVAQGDTVVFPLISASNR